MLPVIIQQPEKSAIVDILTIVVPALVTIIGLFVNYFFINRNIKNEIKKKKADISLEYLSELPINSLELVNIIFFEKDPVKVKEAKEKLENAILAYGSEDAIKILTELKKHNCYKDGIGKYKTMICIAILNCQLKFDLTGIQVNPELWCRVKIPFIQMNLEEKERLKNEINEVVDKLNLSEFLRMK